MAGMDVSTEVVGEHDEGDWTHKMCSYLPPKAFDVADRGCLDFGWMRLGALGAVEAAL